MAIEITPNENKINEDLSPLKKIIVHESNKVTKQVFINLFLKTQSANKNNENLAK